MSGAGDDRDLAEKSQAPSACAVRLGSPQALLSPVTGLIRNPSKEP
jgi:hypothetical protein